MFIFTISILVIMFGLDIALTALNYSTRKNPIPEVVADIYQPDTYQKWLAYTMANTKLSLLTKTVNMIFSVLFLWWIAPKVSDFTQSFSSSILIETLLFIGIYFLLQTVVSIGFDVYDTFVIEQQFGFNTTTIKTYILDLLKNLVLVIILGGSILSGLVTLINTYQTSFVWFAWVFLTILILLINMLYTKLLVPLFNKLTPLEDGELKQQIEAFVAKTGYAINKISVMNASKRSNRLNAYFSGFGKFKHIVLFDTLIAKLSTDEIISVLAHEIGHAKNKDVMTNTIRSILLLGIYLFLFGWLLTFDQLTVAFNLPANHLGFSLILFFIYLQPLGLLIGMISSTISKKAEFKADNYVKKHGYHHALISALKTLARENFANLTPHPLVVTLTYSHPPVANRIKALLD